MLLHIADINSHQSLLLLQQIMIEHAMPSPAANQQNQAHRMHAVLSRVKDHLTGSVLHTSAPLLCYGITAWVISHIGLSGHI